MTSTAYRVHFVNNRGAPRNKRRTSMKVLMIEEKD